MNREREQEFGKKVWTAFVLAGMACLLWLAFGGKDTQASTFTIKTPEQLVNINWKNAGYGPGHTYVIGNDMTISDTEEQTVLLTKGKFVIDLNGHTVQGTHPSQTVFHIAGANVVMKDSKVKPDVPSVRSYGAGAVQITAGKLTIQSGNYLGASDGTNNPSALHVGGGTCIVNGGVFAGAYVGASCMGGTFRINGGTFYGGFPFALMRFGAGTIKISKATFYSGRTNYGYQFAIGNMDNPNYPSTYDFRNWLAKGSSFNIGFTTAYWNLQSSVSAYPSISNIYAVSYQTPELKVTSTVKATKTAIKSVKAAKRALGVKWKRRGNGTSGYQVQYSTSKNFKKSKTVTVKGASKNAVILSRLKRQRTYYVRVRTYRNFNGTKLYSAWSAAKAKKTK